MSRSLFSITGIIEAPVGQVSASLIECPPIGRHQAMDLPYIISSHSRSKDEILVIKGGPVKFYVYTGAEPHLERLFYMDVHKAAHRTTIYGGWWYSCEYILSPHAQGCQFNFDVSNIAQGPSRMLVPLLKDYRQIRSGQHDYSTHFNNILKSISSRLRIKAYIL